MSSLPVGARRPTLWDRTGFTLIELLIAVAIMAILGGAVFACFSGGLRVWERSEYYGRAERSALFVMERVGHDLSNAVLAGDGPFRGGSRELSFLCQSDGYVGPPPAPLQSVSYRFVTQDGTTGVLRRSFPWPGEEGSVLDDLYGSELVAVDFAYASRVDRGVASGWRDAWNSETNLPCAVRVSLEHEDGESLERVFLTGGGAWIPAEEAP